MSEVPEGSPAFVLFGEMMRGGEEYGLWRGDA